MGNGVVSQLAFPVPDRDQAIEDLEGAHGLIWLELRRPSPSTTSSVSPAPPPPTTKSSSLKQRTSSTASSTTSTSSAYGGALYLSTITDTVTSCSILEADRKVPAIHLRRRTGRRTRTQSSSFSIGSDDAMMGVLPTSPTHNTHAHAHTHTRTPTHPGTHTSRRFTVIYSHGNAEDISQNVRFYHEMSQLAGCDVLGYEYPGYSAADGRPSEYGCYAAIDAALAYLVHDCSVPVSQIVLFGRSIGSGPTVELASRTPGLGGMVLQSPISSGARAVLGKAASLLGYPFDIFRNYEKASRVTCPVLVMHGMADDIVPVCNGVELYETVRGSHKGGTVVEPWWADGYGHNDMPVHAIIDRVRGFLRHLEKQPVS